MWYPFDDSVGSTVVSDASGNGHEGTIVGGVTLDSDVARLNGVDGYVKLPDNIMAGLDAITTVVYIERSQREPYFIYGLGNTSNDRDNGNLFTTGNFYRTAISSCHWGCEQSTDTLGINIGRGGWHHLAYTLAGGIGILYLDGQEAARNSNIALTPGEIGNGATVANYLGRSLYSADRFLLGSLDDFQTWDDALTPDTIAAAAEKPRLHPV